jgi:glutamate synthase (NADPH/NADH) small chain
MEQPKVAVQPKEKRVKNFHEVALGYSKKVTTSESIRCPQCSDPVCKKGCPVGIDIPGFIRLLREGNVAGAYEIIRQNNPLPSICGRICSAPCEIACVLTDERAPIGIRALERYAGDFGRPRFIRREKIHQSGKRIAVIGAGPCGLTAAAELAKKGYQPTIYEALDKPGGVLRYGIPEFRVPQEILDREVQEIKALGVEIETNVYFGRTMMMDELITKGFSAVLLTTGAGTPKFMEIKGANLGGVYYGEEFLMRVNLRKTNMFSSQKADFPLGYKIVVIGSGNTALDCARAAARFGRDVTLVFRRTEEEMRTRFEEREYGKEEGIRFEALVRPLEIISDNEGFVNGIKCVRMDYVEKVNAEELELIEVADSQFVMEADTVVIAIGHRPNVPLMTGAKLNLQFNDDGTIKTNELTGMTAIAGVFAAGNVVTNAGAVVQAMASGKKAAQHIDQYLR